MSRLVALGTPVGRLQVPAKGEYSLKKAQARVKCSLTWQPELSIHPYALGPQSHYGAALGFAASNFARSWRLGGWQTARGAHRAHADHGF